MTASPISVGRQRLALDRIAIPGNVRELDPDHVDALAASITLRGLLVPVIVRPAGADFQLVAGFHRFAAHRKLGEKYIDADVRDAAEEHSDRAVENIAGRHFDQKRLTRFRRCSPTGSPRTAPPRRSGGPRRGPPPA